MASRFGQAQMSFTKGAVRPTEAKLYNLQKTRCTKVQGIVIFTDVS